jgi:hypothetical protein
MVRRDRLNYHGRLVFLVMVTYIPGISLWLPRVLGMVN